MAEHLIIKGNSKMLDKQHFYPKMFGNNKENSYICNIQMQHPKSNEIMEKKQIIEAMHNKLHEIDPHAKAILFGSRARGTEKEGSDWDILILLDKPKVTLQDYNKYSYPLRELGWDIDEIINPILFSQREWEENSYTLFNHNVTREGIAI